VNIALWSVAVVLAVAFLAGGAVKIVRPKEQLVTSGFRFAEDFSAGAVKTIGSLEVLAAVGLTLPGLLGIAPILVALAATGVVLLMIGATVTHLRRGEPQAVPVTLGLLALAAFVAWGRFGVVPFSG
jgi:DoxX-like family